MFTRGRECQDSQGTAVFSLILCIRKYDRFGIKLGIVMSVVRIIYPNAPAQSKSPSCTTTSVIVRHKWYGGRWRHVSQRQKWGEACISSSLSSSTKIETSIATRLVPQLSIQSVPCLTGEGRRGFMHTLIQAPLMSGTTSFQRRLRKIELRLPTVVPASRVLIGWWWFGQTESGAEGWWLVFRQMG